MKSFAVFAVNFIAPRSRVSRRRARAATHAHTAHAAAHRAQMFGMGTPSTAEKLAALEKELADTKERVSMQSAELSQFRGHPRTVSTAPLSETPLTASEQTLDGKIRTVCFVVIATIMIAFAMHELRHIMVPFFIALALKYVLTPLINLLSCADHYCDHARFRCPCRLPRWMAVICAILIAMISLLVVFGLVTKSVITFTTHVSDYNNRTTELIDWAYTEQRIWQRRFGMNVTAADEEVSVDAYEVIQESISGLDIGGIISAFLGTAATVAENLLYIFLFLAFMLFGEESEEDEEAEAARRNSLSLTRTSQRRGSVDVDAQAEEQIFVYLKGKVMLSALVAGVHGLTLWWINLNVWLVFGLLSFALNFVPNVGMFLGVCLPMPLVALDDDFTPLETALAFLIPLAVGTIAKDVLEPIVLGKGASLHPVMLMLAILVWGSVWGITGMILAVPITAVGRIYLSSLKHPLPQYLAAKLSGGKPDPMASPERRRSVPYALV